MDAQRSKPGEVSGVAMIFRRHGRVSGFTLLELMLVLLILALLATIAVPQVIRYLGRAKHDTAKIQIDALAAAVDYFHLDVGRYPTQDESLKALVGRPTNEDKWDGPYIKKQDSL